MSGEVAGLGQQFAGFGLGRGELGARGLLGLVSLGELPAILAKRT